MQRIADYRVLCSEWAIYITSLPWGLAIVIEEVVKQLLYPQAVDICCETVFYKWLRKQDSNNGSINKHAKAEGVVLGFYCCEETP